MYVCQHAFHNVCGAEYNLESVLLPLHGLGDQAQIVSLVLMGGNHLYSLSRVDSPG